MLIQTHISVDLVSEDAQVDYQSQVPLLCTSILLARSARGNVEQDSWAV